MSADGMPLIERTSLRETARFVLRLTVELRSDVLRFFGLYSVATLAQVTAVLLVAMLLSPQGSSVLSLETATTSLTASLPTSLAAIGAAVSVALWMDFLADRALIRARQNIPRVAFRSVLLPILGRHDRAVVLAGRAAMAAVQLVVLRGLSLGQPLRLLLLGVFAGLRGLALLLVVFAVAGVSPAAVVAVVLFGAPFFLLGSRAVARVEASRPSQQREARQSTMRLLDGAAAVAYQQRLPLEGEFLVSHGSVTDRLIEDAELAVGRVAESAVGRLLIASRAKFRYQIAIVGIAAAILVTAGLAGGPTQTIDARDPGVLAPTILGSILALRALASAFQGFVRLASSALTVRVLAGIRAKALSVPDPWALRQQLEQAAEVLRGVSGDEDL